MEEDLRISHGEFLRLFSIRAPHLMWFLGAGASAGAGIPTAWDMIWDEVYFRKAWSAESDRRSYIDSAVTRGGESFGQICLAGLLRCDRAKVVWTTNFDHLLEDACAKVYGTTKSLTHANLDNPQIAISAINQSRWPVLVKLHGDFRSDRLKNIKPELETQDAQLRRALVTSSKTNGLIVAGYSGRDPSVMQALTDALSDGPGFPQGLFWLSRRGSQLLESVTALLNVAIAKRVQAAVVEIENFDEFMAELITTDVKIDEPTKRVILPNRKHLTLLSMPSTNGTYPVIRTNALPIS